MRCWMLGDIVATRHSRPGGGIFVGKAGKIPTTGRSQIFGDIVGNNPTTRRSGTFGNNIDKNRLRVVGFL